MKIKYYTHGEELTGFDIALKKGTTIIDTLKIPSVVEGKPIAHIATTIGEAFSKLKGKGISEIKNVLIEEGISSISDHAFANICIKIDKVCWPASCTVIPSYCFYDSHIESITGTDFVTTVGKGAFGRTHVTIFEWPPLCKEIPEGCFDGSSLIEITGIDQVNNIGQLAFSETRLQTFLWPPKCKTIPLYCFYSTPLKNITGIDRVEKIERNAFCGTKLQRFSWPSKCKTIPESCFFSSLLKKIVGIGDVEAIGKDAFFGTKLQRFSWPPKCKTVPESCFHGCCNLKQVEGLEGVTDIGIAAFNETALKTFCWPAGVSATETCLFLSNCEHLEEIIFGGAEIKDVDLECLSYLKDVKKIDFSPLAVVNLLNSTSEKGSRVREKVVLPYYVTEIN